MLSKSINTMQILKTMAEKNYRVAVTKNKNIRQKLIKWQNSKAVELNH